MNKSWKRLLLAAAVLSLLAACSRQAPKPVAVQSFDIAVFVPGVVAGSPVYEQLVEGTNKAASEHPHATVKVLEAGFNQGQWAEKMTSLAATGEYELIVTSNPAMPFVTLEVAKAFPGQKWLNMDAHLDGNPQIATVLYNQMEMTYMNGYLGGLITTSRMPGANPDLKAGMIVAQEYPALTRLMKPGFEKGLKAVDEAITVDYRLIGNWYDANKAAELARSMIDAGVDVILTIAGGANQGVIQAAAERGKYVLFVDANDYAAAPGVIVGCAVLNQARATYERVKLAIEGELRFGRAEILNTRDGYVDFADEDPLYLEAVPADIRERMGEVLKQMRSGDLRLEPPAL